MMQEFEKLVGSAMLNVDVDDDVDDDDDDNDDDDYV